MAVKNLNEAMGEAGPLAGIMATVLPQDIKLGEFNTLLLVMITHAEAFRDALKPFDTRP